MAVHVRYNSWYISLCFLSLCSGFSFAIVLAMINKVNDFTVSRDSWVKYKFIFSSTLSFASPS